MRILIAFILFFNIVNDCTAQKEWNTWYFGTNAGMDFNSGIPVAITNGLINTVEGCATISDTAGNLLFYTDGITVTNRNHVMMPNGWGLLGNSTSTHSAIILPMPGSPGIYYIFTTFVAFAYSIVDMSLDSGSGDVLVKNQLILGGVNSEKQCITRHANGVDMWIVLNITNTFNSYLFSGSGLSSIPVNSVVSSLSGAGPGQIKISPAGNKIAFGTYTTPVAGDVIELFDFDNNTGIVSGSVHLMNGMTQCYGLEFSPDGTKLYTSANSSSLNPLGHGIHQFDLTAGSNAAIQASRTEIVHYASQNLALVGMQLASDYKIYVCTKNSTYMNVINDPNQPGITCNYQDSVLDLAPGISQLGLPTVSTSQFYLTSENDIHENPFHISVYPNPATEFIYISNPKPEQFFNAVLYDLNGRIILESFNNSSQLTMDLGKLQHAVYILEIATENYRIQKRIVKI